MRSARNFKKTWSDFTICESLFKYGMKYEDFLCQIFLCCIKKNAYIHSDEAIKYELETLMS